VNTLAFLLQRKGDYAGAQPLYERALLGLLKISARIRRSHPSLQACIGNYAGCLEKQGRSREDIRNTLEALMRLFGLSLGTGAGREQAGGEPSDRLRPVLEEIMRDRSKLQEIAARLQREDPNLLRELIAFIQSQ
jgi:hypothetical protein